MSYLAMIEQHIENNIKRSNFLREKGEHLRGRALASLCSYDPRSSSWYEGIGEMPRDCHCDHCFYGTHGLAVAILEMLDLLEG